MPGLHKILIILKNNLHIVSKIGCHDSGLERTTRRSRGVRYGSKGEDPRDVEVVCKLEWSIRLNEGYTVNSKSLLAINDGCRICEPNGSASVDLPIVI